MDSESKENRLQFDMLSDGLHPMTRIKMFHSEESFGSFWEGFTVHEIIYVNKAKRELVLQVFSTIQLVAADKFDQRNYLLEDTRYVKSKKAKKGK